MCVFCAFRNYWSHSDQTRCRAPSCPRACLRLPGSWKYQPRGVPPFLRGRGFFSGKKLCVCPALRVVVVQVVFAGHFVIGRHQVAGVEPGADGPRQHQVQL